MASSIVSIVEKVFNAGELLAKENGLDKLEHALSDIGFVAGEFKEFAGDHPVEAAAAFAGAAILITALAPEIAASATLIEATEGMEAIAGTIELGLNAIGLDAGTAYDLSITARSLISQFVANDIASNFFQTGLEGIESSFNELFSSLDGGASAGNISEGGINITKNDLNNGDNFIITDNGKGNDNELHLYLNNSSGNRTLDISHSDSNSGGNIQIANITDDNWSSINENIKLISIQYIDGGIERAIENADGSVTKDKENVDGTSEITVINTDGSSTASWFSGPNGTGNITSQDNEHADGTSDLNKFNSDGSNVDTSYSGPNGTGDPSQVTVSSGGTKIVITGLSGANTAYRVYNGYGFAGGDGPTYSSGYGPIGQGNGPMAYMLGSYAQLVCLRTDPAVLAIYGGGDIFNTVLESTPQNVFSEDVTQSSYGFSVGAVLGTRSGHYEINLPVTAYTNSPVGTTFNLPIVGNVYDFAKAYIEDAEPSIFHIGDADAILKLKITNTATGALSDKLVLSSFDPDARIKSVGSMDPLEAGHSAVISASVNIQETGLFAGPDLNFLSHDSELYDAYASAVNSATYQVNDYADPYFSIGNLSTAKAGSVYDIGNIDQGAQADAIEINLLNAFGERYTDDVKGTISITGGGFSQNFYLDPDVIISTDSIRSLGTLTPDTSVAGEHDINIVFHPTDINDNGFSKALPDVTLTIRDNVTAGSIRPKLDVFASADQPIVEASGPTGGTATFTATANDSSVGTLPVTFKEVLSDGSEVVVHSGDTFSIGLHTIVGIAVDPVGVIGRSAPFSFLVADLTPPTVTASAKSANILASTLAGGVETFTASVSDAVDGSSDPIVFTEQLTGGGTKVVHSGDVFAIGTHTIIASATDAAGNTGQAAPFTFTVTSADVQGKAEDGYLSGATVFADANGNLALDPGEFSTTTDSSGTFTLGGGTGTLIAIGGTDIATGLPFKGVLEAPAGSTVISPLTTLVAQLVAAGVANPVQEADTALGLPTTFDLTHADPVALAAGGDPTGQAALQAQAAIADTAALIAAGLTATGGVDPATAYARVATALASRIAAGQTVTLTDAATVEVIGTAAGLNATTAASIGTIAANANAALGSPQNTLAGVEIRTQGALATAVTNAAGSSTKLQALATASGSNLDLPPTPTDDAVNAVENTPLTIAASSLLANDTDPDSDTLTITGVKNAAEGQASFDPQSNTITFTPTDNFSGNASFAYTVSDGKGGMADATVAVTVAPALVGGGQGDVHYTTFDGLHYDLQATGSFLIARATSGPALEIQGRAEGKGVSFLTAVTIATDGHRLTFDAGSNALTVDGSAAPLSPGGELDLNGFALTESASGAYTLRDSAQDIFKIYDRDFYLDLFVQPGSSRAGGSFEGLLGDFDRNPLNDLVIPGHDTRDGLNSTAYLEGAFADKWRVPDMSAHHA